MLDRGLTKEIDDLIGRELRGKLNEALLLIMLINNYHEFHGQKESKSVGFRGGKAKVKEGLTTRELADELEMPQSTVATAVARLVKKGFLTHSKGMPVKITKEGRFLGNERLRHHRLLEVLLVETLGMDHDDAHNESLKLMLLVSCAIINQIDERFNFPENCPCGHTIPTTDICKTETELLKVMKK